MLGEGGRIVLAARFLSSVEKLHSILIPYPEVVLLLLGVHEVVETVG